MYIVMVICIYVNAALWVYINAALWAYVFMVLWVGIYVVLVWFYGNMVIHKYNPTGHRQDHFFMKTFS